MDHCLKTHIPAKWWGPKELEAMCINQSQIQYHHGHLQQRKQEKPFVCLRRVLASPGYELTFPWSPIL